jgi:uncharacterized membrane protein
MAPLVVLFGSTLLLRLAGTLGVRPLRTWRASARGGLVAMLLFTGASHYAPSTRADLVRMVPPVFGNPGLWVTLTGVAELAGAVGLLVPATRRLAGICLVLLMIALFPANIRAARESLEIAGRPATPLPLRTAMQVLFVAWILWVSRSGKETAPREGGHRGRTPTRLDPASRTSS